MHNATGCMKEIEKVPRQRFIIRLS